MENRDFKIEIVGKIENPANDNVDVFVQFDNDEQYVGSFFTIANIADLLRQKRLSGENSNGLYFWSSDMIIMEEITEDNISITIQDMLKEGGFYGSFSPTNKKAKARKELESPVVLNDED